MLPAHALIMKWILPPFHGTGAAVCFPETGAFLQVIFQVSTLCVSANVPVGCSDLVPPSWEAEEERGQGWGWRERWD